jgi:hypothetical protein
LPDELSASIRAAAAFGIWRCGARGWASTGWLATSKRTNAAAIFGDTPIPETSFDAFDDAGV